MSPCDGNPPLWEREDNDSNVQVMIAWLIWITWTPMPAVLSKKAVTLNHPLTPLKENNTKLWCVFFDISLSKLLKDQSICRWFETSWRPCDVPVMAYIPANAHSPPITSHPTRDQSVYHACTQVWKAPPFCGAWTKNNCFFLTKIVYNVVYYF